MGVTPLGPGCEPTASAAPLHSASSQSRIPNAAHTPGPWKVGGTGIFPSVVCSNGFAIVVTGMSKRSLAECRANARLIAVAPDMLEALYQYESDLLYPPTGDSRERRLERVRKVIAAASGIEARSDETPQAAQPEGREPDPKGDAQPTPSPHPRDPS